MKKFITAVLLCFLVISLAGCGGESPEQAVNNALGAIKTADVDTASKYIDYNGLMKTGESGSVNSEESEEMVKLMMKNLTYKVISSTENGDEATVQAEITNTDMSKIMSEFISEAFSLAFSGLSEEQMNAEMTNKFNELLNRDGNETVTKTVDIELTKAGSRWKIKISDDFADAVFGGMISYATNLSNSLGGTTEAN
jgi:hypothetical protein